MVFAGNRAGEPGIIFDAIRAGQDVHGNSFLNGLAGILGLEPGNRLIALNKQGGRAVEVAPKVIADLLELGPDATLSLLDEEPQVGGKVRIIRGIFAGSEGEVLRLHGPQKRIAVLLELLGSAKPVELSSEDVENA